MSFQTGSKNGFSVKAYKGDNKTLLAFNFADAASAKNLAGFTIQCQPPGQPAYYLLNELQFQDPSKHSQVSTQKPNSSVNAPLQKYRWVHVTGSMQQGTTPVVGNYTYTVTPRYFDTNQSMQPLDSSLSASVSIAVGPFTKGSLALGFTRGYMQSEAFAHHFGAQTKIIPAGKQLEFDTSAQAGTNNGQPVTYAQIYQWMGSTARQQIFAVLNSVVNDSTLQLDVFAYDLNEPDVVKIFLQLAAQGRIRIILDNAKLHLSTKTAASPEDEFTTLFKQQAKGQAAILRGSFGRYSHDKIFIVSRNGTPTQVLTGSTNFSVTGLYVNANHVLVFTDSNVAAQYSKVFEQSWSVLTQFPKTPSARAAAAFASTSVATQPYVYQSASVPKMSITFSPHTKADVNTILDGISNRAKQEDSAAHGNVLFAVMQLTGSQTPVYNTLKAIYQDASVYSYGISDSPGGTHLYAPGSKEGVLVTGKPGKTTLPPPFDQVPSPPGHEIHDKFVVCGLNGTDPTVYCGSSNLATGGEASNGDNLLQIHDADVATAFAIEALLLVDHYNFLDRYANPKSSNPSKKKSGGSPAASKSKKKKSPKSPPKKAPAKTPKKSARRKPGATRKPTRKRPARKSGKKRG
jgi:hypothetical protein